MKYPYLRQPTPPLSGNSVSASETEHGFDTSWLQKQKKNHQKSSNVQILMSELQGTNNLQYVENSS